MERKTGMVSVKTSLEFNTEIDERLYELLSQADAYSDIEEHPYDKYDSLNRPWQSEGRP